MSLDLYNIYIHITETLELQKKHSDHLLYTIIWTVNMVNNEPFLLITVVGSTMGAFTIVPVVKMLILPLATNGPIVSQRFHW
jgi:hypothetical protein